MKLLSTGMAFCDIPLRPCPQNILELDNWHIDPVKHQIGGDAMTVAVVCAKMGEEVRIATHLGDDNNGEFVRQSSEAFGVEQRDPEAVEKQRHPGRGNPPCGCRLFRKRTGTARDG